jgi:hypothetical protein
MPQNKMSFEEWKLATTQALERMAHVGCDDIPDWDYYSAWTAGVSPKQAAREALVAADFPADLLPK